MLLRNVFTLLLLTVEALAQTQVPLRLVTFNIRYAATSLETNEKPWATRRPLLVNLLSQTAANVSSGEVTIIGMQEVLNAQLNDIKSGLGSSWTHIGVGRDDGRQSGEYSPILYRPAELHLLFNETKWLSPTPNTPSFGWGAGSRRIVTVAVFEHVATGKRFIAANTHLDNVSSQARSNGAKLILQTIQDVQATWGPVGVYLTGDFNSAPGGDAYTAVQNSGYLSDLYSLASTSQRFGQYNTYTGFDPSKESSVGGRIDFIWLGPVSDKRWTVNRYEVLSNVQNNVYISDHRPVVGDVVLVA